ncbi:hypothetical protein O0S10_06170 [Methanocorpusculum sp. MG]|uniref:Uncharacterized protein n=1 Tax=Methanocorpusculum petauri TaxID=3002863 RepID=A0ABT4IGE8_9EURY|nr:hypothetical protein [Methanocorpusculum petauri]MCZ0860813.1 hypothetical protein [Methanocorpusculum petauri]
MENENKFLCDVPDIGKVYVNVVGDASVEATAVSRDYRPGNIGSNHEEQVEDTGEIKILE